MFEKFNVSGFYATEQAVLSLYAAGRISGCTVDIGHGKIGVCKCLSVVNSKVLECLTLMLIHLFFIYLMLWCTFSLVFSLFTDSHCQKAQKHPCLCMYVYIFFIWMHKLVLAFACLCPTVHACTHAGV